MCVCVCVLVDSILHEGMFDILINYFLRITFFEKQKKGEINYKKRKYI